MTTTMNQRNESVVARRTRSDEELRGRRRRPPWTRKISISLGRIFQTGRERQPHRYISQKLRIADLD
jgi:hypothetical protein